MAKAPDLDKVFHPLYGYPVAALAFARGLAGNLRHLGLGHQPRPGATVPASFFGVNIAPAADPATDDYLLQQLAELGIHQVRMDYSYNSPGAPAQRLLERLLDADIEVLLNLLPPLEAAPLLHRDEAARQQWTSFLQQVFGDFAGRVSCFEIGNTPNRGKWSGFSAHSFLAAWQLAVPLAQAHDLQLAGPNVSDYEPLYNATFLPLMRRLGAAPAIHSDNLFVERVVEPEAFDHRVLGRVARDALKLNLVKKARILQAIGEDNGCQALYCTYTCWTIKRLSRRFAQPEQKRVDYLLRYLVLAATSGALERVYWGPLVCSRDGLIDDGAQGYPVVDQVSFYEKIRGGEQGFKPTPAFHALAQLTRRLAGAQCTALRHDPDGSSLFAFRGADEQHFLLAWCRDGGSLPLDAVLQPQQLATARFFDALGEPLAAPLVINEHPLYIVLESSWIAPAESASPRPETSGIVHLSCGQWQSAAYDDGRWIGARLLRADAQQEDMAAADSLLPSNIPKLEETAVLRDVRNRLWNVRDPRGQCEQVTIKLNRVKGIKRFTYRFRPSKGRRHWNNACQMLRRDVHTPLPLGFYESPQKPGINESWYLCQFVPDARSARDVYAAFRDGATEYLGHDKRSWLELLSGFVCHMHDKQVIHRDLSAGNLLLEILPDGDIRPQAIDIGRAWIWSGPGSKVRDRHRLVDLIRIAYKLNWSDRKAFIRCYEAHLGRRLTRLWRLPFHYYDNKQALKKAIKGKRKRTPRQK